VAHRIAALALDTALAGAVMGVTAGRTAGAGLASGPAMASTRRAAAAGTNGAREVSRTLEKVTAKLHC
jgi:hypothetical protein